MAAPTKTETTDKTESQEDPHFRLLYDGDCGFCKYSVDYCSELTSVQVDYIPYQQAVEDYPTLSVEDCQRAIQLIKVDGPVGIPVGKNVGKDVGIGGNEIVSGAQAAFQLLALGGRPTMLFLYCHLSIYAWFTELVYGWVSRHRGLVYRICKILLGSVLRPLQYDLVSWLFTRGFAILCGVSFLSFYFQARGLVGANGILPLDEYMPRLMEVYGDEYWWRSPSLFWLDTSDRFILFVCGTGIVFSALLFFNLSNTISLATIYICYLSITGGFQIFTSFQWDVMLLECCFLVLILQRWPLLGIWLMRWLLFRFMLLGGAVKMLSGDPSWLDGTALTYHFETQPLPTVFAWYADKLPVWLLKTGVSFTFLVELILPILLLLPKKPRCVAGLSVLLLQLIILITGNYNFFNLLTMLLCLFAFDDQQLRRWLGKIKILKALSSFEPKPVRISVGGWPTRIAGSTLLIGILSFSGVLLYSTLSQSAIPRSISNKVMFVRQLHIVNSYGPFAVMTKRRLEIEIQGSNDGVTWQTYEFKHKPGQLDRMPTWVAPHQPRLDWHMWFAALGDINNNIWLQKLIHRLLQGTPEVHGLFKTVPFIDRPPKMIRSQLYHYQFTDFDENGWWRRELIGSYSRPATLEDFY